MKHKFTPGPWKVDRDENFILSEGFGDVACIVNIENREEREANRALIAAAPELYEALMAIVDVFPERPGEEVLSKINKALAKARGEKA